VDLADFEILNLHLNISLGVGDLKVGGAGEDALLVELADIDMGKLDVFIHKSSDLIGFIYIPFDVLHLLPD
jgi:hypothetical protein